MQLDTFLLIFQVCILLWNVLCHGVQHWYEKFLRDWKMHLMSGSQALSLVCAPLAMVIGFSLFCLAVLSYDFLEFFFLNAVYEIRYD